MRKLKLIWFVVAFGSLAFGHSAYAFRFSPIYATLSPEGRGKSASFTVENTQNTEVAVQITMVRRSEDVDGNETNPSAKELFNVFPKQLRLGPGQTRTVRVTWLGKEKSDSELAFRLLAEQLEIDGLEKKSADKGGQIKILMAYKASLYVAPTVAVAADVVVENAKVVTEAKSGSRLDMVFFNRGKRHLVLLEPILNLSFKDAAGKEVNVKLEGKDLEQVSENNILPGNKRHYSLPWKSSVPAGPITVVLKSKNEE